MPVASTPRPALTPTPPPAPADYVGHVPAGPAPVSYTAPEPVASKKMNILPFVIGGVVLFFICLCVSILWYIDANYLWCTFFPFLGGC
jgi:hypothetical protein